MMPSARCRWLIVTAAVAILQLVPLRVGAQPQNTEEGLALTGHLSAVTAAEFTPDGQFAVTVSTDETARFWNATTGEMLRVFRGHQGPLYCLAVSADGGLLVTGAQDNTVRLWDLPRTRPIRQFAAHDGAAHWLARSPDSQHLVSVGADTTVRLHALSQVATMPVAVRAGHLASVTRSAFRPDNALFATADAAGRVLLWSPYVERPQGSIGAHPGGVTGLTFHPNNQQLITTGEDGTLKVWQLPTLPREIAANSGALRALSLANPPLVITGGEDKSVRVFDINSGQQVREMLGHAAAISAVAHSPNQALLISADEAGHVRCWQLGDAAPRGEIVAHQGLTTAVAFHPDNQRFATTGADGSLKIWLVPQAVVPLNGHAQPVRTAVASRDGQMLVTAGDDLALRVWNAAGQAVRAINGPTQSVGKLALRGDSAQLASGDAAGNILLVSPQDGSLQTTLGAHNTAIAHLEYAMDGQSLISIAGDGIWKRWKLPIEAAKPLSGHSQPLRDVATSPDGTLVATASADQSVRLWKSDTGELVRTLDAQPGAVHAVAFSDDGSLLLAAGEAGHVIAWNVGDGQVRYRWLGHAGAIHDVALHAGSQQIATADADGAVRVRRFPAERAPIDGITDQQAAQLWTLSRDGRRLAIATTVENRPAILIRESESGKLLATLLGHEGAVTALTFSGNGQRLISGAADRTARVWDLSDEKFPEVARFAEHAGNVVAAALTEDGAIAFTSGTENNIHQWSIADGSETRALSGHGGQVTALQVLGNSVLSASADGTVRQWNVADGAAQRTVNHGAAVRCMALSHDGQLLATAGDDRAVKTWNTQDGAAKATLVGGEQPISSLAFSIDDQQLAALTGNELRIWTRDGKPLERLDVGMNLPGLGMPASATSFVVADNMGQLHRHAPTITALINADLGMSGRVAFSADGQQVFYAGEKQPVQSWNLAAGAPARKLPSGANVVDMSLAGDASWLAAAVGNNVMLWNLSAADGPATITLPHAAAVRRVAVSRDGTRVVTASDEQIVRIFETASGREIERFAAQTTPVTALGFVTAERLVSGGQDNTGRIWNVAATLLPQSAAEKPPAGLAMLETELAAISGTENFVQCWDAQSQPTRRFNAATPLINLIADPTGQQLAAADNQGRIYLWDSASAAEPRLVEVGAPVNAMSFSGDGQKIAVATAMGRLRVFRSADLRWLEDVPAAEGITQLVFAGTGPNLLTLRADNVPQLYHESLLRPIDAHASGATSVVFHNNGEQLFSAGKDGSVQQWNTGDGQHVRSFAGHSSAVTAMTLSPDSSKLLVAAEDKSVRLWNTADGALLATWMLRTIAHAAHVSPDGQRVVFAGEDQSVHVWDLAAGKELEFVEGHSGPVLGARFSTDNRTIVSASTDGTLRVAQVSAQRVIAAHETAVRSLALLTGGGQAITCGADGLIRMWELGGGQPVRDFEGLAGAVTVAVRSDNQRVAGGSESGQIIVWNAGNAEQMMDMRSEAAITALAFSPDNQKLAVADASNKIQIYGPPTPPQPGVELVLHQTIAAPAVVTRLEFSADNRLIYATDLAGQVSEWAYASPTALRQFNHGGPVFGVAITADASTIVSCSADQTVRIWDANTGGQRAQLNGHQGAVYGVALSRDGALIVSSGADTTLRLWDLQGGRQLKQLTSTGATMYSLAVHPNNNLVAAGGADRKVHFLDLLTGNLQRTLEGHTDFVHSVNFNSEGTRAVSYGYAGTIMVWNPADGQKIFETQIGRVGNTARYSPDGTRLLLATGDGLARIIEVPAGAR